MAFRMVHARYDSKSRRACVELRAEGADGGEVMSRPSSPTDGTSTISKRALEQELATKDVLQSLLRHQIQKHLPQAVRIGDAITTSDLKKLTA